MRSSLAAAASVASAVASAVAGVVIATAVAVAGLAAVSQWLGGSSLVLAVLIVWLPMVVLGTTSHFVTIRLPARWHRIREWESDGRVYERLGVRLAKSALRRGPFAVFNPGLHLPKQHTETELAALERRMCEAEATHAILFVGAIGAMANAFARGWPAAAAVIAVCNVLMNGYPAMLQRYNRTLLRRRFGRSALMGG